LLFVCVVSTQLGMATHALTHFKRVVDHRTQVTKAAAPVDSLCELCLAFQGVSSGLAGSYDVPPTVDPVVASAAVSVAVFDLFRRAPFRSRAPPSRSR